MLTALLAALSEITVQLDVRALIRIAQSSSNSHFGARLVDCGLCTLSYEDASYHVFDVSNDLAKRASAPGIP